MKFSSITWQGGEVEDIQLLAELPAELVGVLKEINGFILHHGAFHLRGAVSKPEWHSLGAAWKGPNAFHRLYSSVVDSDIPFGQDQLGDQYILRDGSVFRLVAETGDVEPVCQSFQQFIIGVEEDIESFLNVGLNHKLEPGQLLHAYPPFCTKEAADGVSLKACDATELIGFHAEMARQIASRADGSQIRIKFTV